MPILNLIGAYSELDQCLFWTWSVPILNLIGAYSELDRCLFWTWSVPILNLIGAYSKLGRCGVLACIRISFCIIHCLLVGWFVTRLLAFPRFGGRRGRGAEVAAGGLVRKWTWLYGWLLGEVPVNSCTRVVDRLWPYESTFTEIYNMESGPNRIRQSAVGIQVHECPRFQFLFLFLSFLQATQGDFWNALPEWRPWF